MINIKPILKPVNYQEIVEYNENENMREMYNEFYNKVYDNSLSKEQNEKNINERWKKNYGEIPDSKPKEIYQCHIYSKSIKIVLTVIKNEDISKNNREFQVIKLNTIYIDDIDSEKYIEKDSNGKIIFKNIYKNKIDSRESYIFNYEDDWFKNLYIEDILKKVRIKINEYTSESKNPTLYINSMNYMESCSFDFYDDYFKEKLYDKIDEIFKKSIKGERYK